MKINVVELFAGVGGFRVGLNKIKSFNKKTGRANERGRWNFVWANQWEPSTKIQHAFKCYVARFGANNVSNVDINKVDKKTIPAHDLLVGGFPCQDYSVARTKANEQGIQGKKGVLWWDIAAVLREKQPNFILLENVDRLLKSPANQRGRDFAVMLNTFDELGYFVEWRMINAGSYNMPQRRKRVFIFAYRKNTKHGQKIARLSDNYQELIDNSLFNVNFPVTYDLGKLQVKNINKYKDSVAITNEYNLGRFESFGVFVNGISIDIKVTEIAEKLYPLSRVIKQAEKYSESYDDYIIDEKALEKWKYLKGSKTIPRIGPNNTRYSYSEGQMTFPDALHLPGRTMLTSEATINRSSHIVFNEELQQYRKITEIEAELLQMFPPNWTDTGMSARQRYFMMGNALVTGVISRLENNLFAIISEENN